MNVVEPWSARREINGRTINAVCAMPAQRRSNGLLSGVSSVSMARAGSRDRDRKEQPSASVRKTKSLIRSDWGYACILHIRLAILPSASLLNRIWMAVCA